MTPAETPPIIDTPPPPPVLDRMIELGAHLMPIRGDVKTPVNRGWPAAPALTVTAAASWLSESKNVGVNLALSRMICLDAENQAATAAITAAGFTLTVIPAKAQDARIPEKHGGSHTWLRLPDQIDVATLPSDAMGITLPGGGLIDVLAGRRYAVAPPSQLHEAPGYFYAPAAGGALDPADPELDIATAPMWLFDRAEPCPPGLEPLHGCLTAVTPYERTEADARSQELTDRIDAVPWAVWIGGDPKLINTGELDGCGCEIWHFAGADNAKSATLHDGCGHGCGAHIWSGTMIGQLELDGDHMSRLDLSVALRGGLRSRGSRREAAAAVGIELGGEREPLAGITPEHLRSAADDLEAAGDTARAADLRANAAALAAVRTAASAGEIHGASPIAGGFPAAPAPPALAVLQGGGAGAVTADRPPLQPVPRIGTVGGGPVAPTAGATALQLGPPPALGQPPASNPAEESVALAAEPGDTAAVDPQAAAQAAAEAHMAAADAPELLNAIFCTPLLQQIRHRAKDAQVSPMLALSANISGLFSVVPHHVCLPKLVGKRRSPLNLLTVAVDESGGGKGGMTAVDIDPIPPCGAGLPDAVTKRLPVPAPETVGSGEAIASCYATMETDDKTGEKSPVVHTPSVWLAWDEVSKIIAVRDRKGSTIEAELCHGFSGERLGSKTKTNPYWVNAGTYRQVVSIAAQLVTAAGLLADEYTGLVQRIWWVSAAYRIGEDDAQPEKLAAGRRSLDGEWFAEPDDDQPLIPVELPEWPKDDVLRVAASVAAEIEAARADHGRGRKAHPWDRHVLLIRLRLAAAGAILHGCGDVTAEWWEWAGLLIQHSQHVRAAVVALRGTVAAAVATESGEADAIRAEARSSVQWRRAVDATKAWASAREWFTEKQAARAAGPGFRRDNMSEILTALMGIGELSTKLVRVPSAGGDVLYYRRVPAQ